MTCWQCNLHGSDDEHERDVTEKAARLSEGFCIFCSGQLEVRDEQGWHCGFYQRPYLAKASNGGYEIATFPL